MSLKVNRIKAYLDKSFEKIIDLEDIQNKPEVEKKKQFYSRSLAAYALTILCGIDAETAANSITDGYEDQGLDAIFFDTNSKDLWLVQSKFIENGTGGLDNGDIEKFCKGVTKLINSELDRFNIKIKDRREEIIEALDDSTVRIQLLICYTSNQFSSHNNQSIEDLLKLHNDADELLLFNNFNLNKAYKGLEMGASFEPINEDILIYNWGFIEDPWKSYYGLINGADLASLFSKYGKRLFTENIRSFLGNSEANVEINKTIKSEPENFFYFNNGITVLCESIKKKPIGGGDRAIGAFACTNISVVNGAQTLGSVGISLENSEVDLSLIKVLVKLISLEGSPSGFGPRITIATNTQNKVEKKDFVSLDTEQGRLRVELKIAGIDYHFKRSNEKIIPDETNYLLEEVAYSLACLFENVDYSTIVKKESGRLWDDVTSKPYTDLFHEHLSAQKIIKAVKIYRFITNLMKELAIESEGRERSINKYGNAIVSHLVFQQIPKNLMAENYSDFDAYYNNELQKLAGEVIDCLHTQIETFYFDSMIVYVLRNYSKCRLLKEEITKML